jgi:hypothetical protein
MAVCFEFGSAPPATRDALDVGEQRLKIPPSAGRRRVGPGGDGRSNREADA